MTESQSRTDYAKHVVLSLEGTELTDEQCLYFLEMEAAIDALRFSPYGSTRLIERFREKAAFCEKLWSPEIVEISESAPFYSFLHGKMGFVLLLIGNIQDIARSKSLGEANSTMEHYIMEMTTVISELTSRGMFTDDLIESFQATWESYANEDEETKSDD